MNPDTIPSTVKAVARGIAVGRLEETYSGQLPAAAARDLADHVIAYTWPAIEAHIREQVAQKIQAASLALLEEIDQDDRRPSHWERHQEWCDAADVARRP